MKSLIRFDPNGTVSCLYTEAIDLRVLGTLEVKRATAIRFHPVTQQWKVHRIGDDVVLHADPSRHACILWEREHLA